jgi:hypothetical protein
MSDRYKKMLELYAQNSSSGKKETKFNLNNYFTTKLPDGTTKLEKRIRILPSSSNPDTWIEIMYGHKLKVNGEYKVFPCLKHEDNSACPFCESRELLLATGSESDKKEAKNYSARKYYIIKLIERGKEDDGVKFWRITHSYKNDGIFDKIMAAQTTVGHDISDPETGRDLIITIGKDHEDNSIVQSVTYPLESTKLSNDVEKYNEWVSDEKVWRSVYSLKPYDYLKLMVRGKTPKWDKVRNCYVDANEIEDDPKEDSNTNNSEITMGNITSNSSQKLETIEEIVDSNIEANDDDADDLPF